MSLENAKFAENFVPIDTAALVGVTTEQNTGYVSVAGYVRLAVLVHALAVGTTLDVDIEIGTSSGGADAVTLKSMTQLDGNDDGALVCIDIRPDEFNNPANTSVMNFNYLNVEVTPSGSATVSVLVLGVPVNKGEASSNWSESVD